MGVEVKVAVAKAEVRVAVATQVVPMAKPRGAVVRSQEQLAVEVAGSAAKVATVVV